MKASTASATASEINYQQMYTLTKQRLALETKPIKKLLIYNYINDDIHTLILDCRNTDSIIFPTIQNQSSLALRLIMIFKDNTNLKTEPTLESVRKYIKEHDELSQGIFHIFESNYNEFISDYRFLNIKENTFIMLNNYHLPLCVLNGIIFVGGFINSKNKKNISLLKIKTMISIMNENDKDLFEMFGDNYRNFQHDESSHDEVEFNDIVDYILEQINKKQTPILLYCFSGKSVSLATIAAFLMRQKNWPLQFAVGYVLKLSPSLNIPSWLFTQLQRWDAKKDKIKKDS